MLTVRYNDLIEAKLAPLQFSVSRFKNNSASAISMTFNKCKLCVCVLLQKIEGSVKKISPIIYQLNLTVLRKLATQRECINNNFILTLSY